MYQAGLFDEEVKVADNHTVGKNADEFHETVRLHSLWLAGDPAGRKAVIHRKNFEGVCASNIDLSGAEITDTMLHNCRLVGVNFTDARIIDVVASWGVFTNSRWRNATIAWTSLEKANMAGASMEGCNIYQVNLRKAKLCRTNLMSSSIRCGNFKASKLHETMLIDAMIVRCDFLFADLTGSRWWGAKGDLNTFRIDWENLWYDKEYA